MLQWGLTSGMRLVRDAMPALIVGVKVVAEWCLLLCQCEGPGKGDL
jgi:hypothetical protein